MSSLIFKLHHGRRPVDERPCYPPGHEETWGAITRGTLLEESKYPHPVYRTALTFVQKQQEITDAELRAFLGIIIS